MEASTILNQEVLDIQYWVKCVKGCFHLLALTLVTLCFST